MNILNFDKWNYINEKFNAEIKDIEKNDKTNDIKDSIVVKETENSEPIIYSIDGDSITSNKNKRVWMITANLTGSQQMI